MSTPRLSMLTVGACILAAYNLFGSDPVPAARQKRPVALVGGTIHPVSGETIPKGTILFDKGIITSVGVDVSIPADAERIDVTGRHVYPGLIDANSAMGLIEIESVNGSNDLSESGVINPNVRAEVAVNPESELIPVARSGGVAVVATAPSGGIIAGTSAAMMTDGWTWEEMTLKAPLGLVVNWPAMTYVRPRFQGQQTQEEWMKQRDSSLKLLRESFASARAYMKARGAEGENEVPYHKSDIRWEAMIPVLQKKTPVWVYADELAQLQAAVSWAEQEGVNIVIVGGADSWRVTDQLKAKNVPVVITDVLNSPNRRFEDYDLVYSTPGKLRAAGIRFCIAGSKDPSFSRNLGHNAAAASAFGLSKEDALKAVTLWSAEILGIGEKVGSLEKGKDATLIIADGDPLEFSTTVEQVYIQGKRMDMRDKHKQLYGKYQEKYRQMKF